jgi:hypothetical protein
MSKLRPFREANASDSAVPSDVVPSKLRKVRAQSSHNAVPSDVVPTKLRKVCEGSITESRLVPVVSSINYDTK